MVGWVDCHRNGAEIADLSVIRIDRSCGHLNARIRSHNLTAAEALEDRVFRRGAIAKRKFALHVVSELVVAQNIQLRATVEDSVGLAQISQLSIRIVDLVRLKSRITAELVRNTRV